jgi:hypothetical protein
MNGVVPDGAHITFVWRDSGRHGQNVIIEEVPGGFQCTFTGTAPEQKTFRDAMQVQGMTTQVLEGGWSAFTFGAADLVDAMAKVRSILNASAHLQIGFFWFVTPAGDELQLQEVVPGEPAFIVWGATGATLLQLSSGTYSTIAAALNATGQCSVTGKADDGESLSIELLQTGLRRVDQLLAIAQAYPLANQH